MKKKINGLNKNINALDVQKHPPRDPARSEFIVPCIWIVALLIVEITATYHVVREIFGEPEELLAEFFTVLGALVFSVFIIAYSFLSPAEDRNRRQSTIKKEWVRRYSRGIARWWKSYHLKAVILVFIVAMALVQTNFRGMKAETELRASQTQERDYGLFPEPLPPSAPLLEEPTNNSSNQERIQREIDSLALLGETIPAELLAQLEGETTSPGSAQERTAEADRAGRRETSSEAESITYLSETLMTIVGFILFLCIYYLLFHFGVRLSRNIRTLVLKHLEQKEKKSQYYHDKGQLEELQQDLKAARHHHSLLKHALNESQTITENYEETICQTFKMHYRGGIAQGIRKMPNEMFKTKVKQMSQNGHEPLHTP